MRYAADQKERQELVPIGEVARLLGISERHVRRLVFERRIPYVKCGHLIRFDLGEIESRIDACRVAAETSR